MGLSGMKEQLHQRLWSAQERWFGLHGQGITKHELKMLGLRANDNLWSATRDIIFTGTTRCDYEDVLKGFLDFAHERGTERNADLDKRDMRDYLDHLLDRGAGASYLDKVRCALVKFGSLYGKFESFHSTSRKFGAKIRQLVREGRLAEAAHQRIMPQVAERAIERLRALDERFEVATGLPRGYHLAAELQLRCGLRAVEATERLTPDRVVGGQVVVLGKGGRIRTLAVPLKLFARLRDFFDVTGARSLAELRAYEAAFARAVLDVGGGSTGTHALRRLWAENYKNERYRLHLSQGRTPKAALEQAIADALEALGHGRDRIELRAAYLRAA